MDSHASQAVGSTGLHSQFRKSHQKERFEYSIWKNHDGQSRLDFRRAQHPDLKSWSKSIYRETETKVLLGNLKVYAK